MNEKHLPSLSIQNYRSLDGLQVERLGHVNLIVGPNNIGKSSLLEAILLCGTNGSILSSLLTIRDILRSRDECNVEFPDRFQSSPFLGLHHLFTGFPTLSSRTVPISISTLDKKHSVDLRIDDAKLDPKRIETEPPVTFSISAEDSGQIDQMFVGASMSGFSSSPMEFKHYLDNKCLYLSPNVSDSARGPSSKLWEQIEISGRETAVIDSLRLIDRGVEKVFFIGSNPRIPVCRIKGLDRPVPLHNLGDGVSRLFELILGIVNIAGGICLIDEFENGLHWSVQEQVWDVVFKTAKNLDVQIFATTHSLDAVKAFQTVALRQDDESFGGIVQMKKQSGKTIAKPIFGENIRKVLQYEVEVR